MISGTNFTLYSYNLNIGSNLSNCEKYNENMKFLGSTICIFTIDI